VTPRPIRTLAFAVAAALVAAALPTRGSADERSAYVELKGGAYLPTATSVGGAFDQISFTQFPPSGDVELALGTSFGILGVQLSGGYLWTSKDATGGTLQVTGAPITGVLQLRIPIAFVVPYVEAGVGVFINTAKISTVQTAASSTKTTFMAPLGGGIDFLLGPILLGAEVRYLYISPTTYTWNGFPVSQLKMDGVVITGNIGYRF